MASAPHEPTPKRVRITLIAFLILLVAVAAMIAFLGGGELAYESPDYRVVETIGDVEIRQYQPYLVAETRVEGDLESAGSQGFRILAKYIFGDNQGDRKIAMTAPVSQEKTDGRKIAMTAPVTQERAGDQFAVRFMMPSQYTDETLPAPNDPRIEIKEIPGRRLAAIRYSGRWTKARYEAHLSKLVDALRREGLEPVGEPLWARYNPPFMPWFLRRNEILTAFVSSEEPAT